MTPKYTLNRFPSIAASRFNTYSPTWIPVTGWDGIRDGYPDSGARTGAILTRLEEYTWRADSASGESDGYRLLSSVDYVYEESPQINESILLEYSATQVYKSSLVGDIQPSYVYHYPVYGSAKSSRNPVSRLSVTYHPHGNDSVRVDMRYVPRTSLSEPTRLAAVESREGGVTRRLEYSYPDTFGDDDGEGVGDDDEPEPEWARQLASAHRLSIPVRKDWYVHSSDAQASTPLRSERIEYGISQVGLQEALLPALHCEYYLGEECWREEILSRDGWGNVTSVKQKGQPLTNITWGYGGLYPTQITQDSLTTTYTWRPGIGLSSTTSPSGVVTRYEYDGAGRLTAIKDGQGRTLESWEYHLFNDGGDGHLSRTHRRYRTAEGNTYGKDITWWNTLGMHQQDILEGAAGDGRDLVAAYGADALLHDDARAWIPYPAVTEGVFQESAEDEAAAFHGDSLAYSAKTYEKSARGKVLSAALPGYAGEHETSYTEDVCTAPFPRYVWVELTPAVTGVRQLGSYALSEVVVSSITDADGRIRTTYADHAGRTLATATGDDAPTYYIYDSVDQLRAVAGGGIEMSDTLSMWRYSYDTLGRVESKGIPGCVNEYYTYDEEGRVIAARRGGYLKEMQYDSLGRVTRVYLTDGDVTRRILEEHGYSYDRETFARYAVMGSDPTDTSCVSVTYRYDDRGRRDQTLTSYPDGDRLTETLVYDLSGDVISSTSVVRHGSQSRSLTISTTRDALGRPVSGTSSLRRGSLPLATVRSLYSYDDIGRANGKTVSTLNGSSLTTTDSYSLQGWLTSRTVTKDGEQYFKEFLGYSDGDILHGIAPSYTGLVTSRTTAWGTSLSLPDYFAYDNSSRLVRESARTTIRDFEYDARGNITSETATTLRGTTVTTSIYDGDRLLTRGGASFRHDEHGRMVYDGLAGLDITYNAIDLPQYIGEDGGVQVSFRYSADGTKLGESLGDGSGLEYRGPFVYRRSASGLLTLESVACPEGRLTENGALFHVTDYLGSVRAVIGAGNGSVYESSNYSAYGMRTARASSTPPSGITLRDHYTGCEDLAPDFSIPYADHSARLYSAAQHRWVVPDPLSEKYYGISPYAYCGNNPMGAVDVSGRDTLLVVDRPNRPADIGIKGTSYTAELILIQQGIITARAIGSSYPNSKSNSDNSTDYNTIKEGEYLFNNKFGHKDGSQRGLNIVDDQGNRIVSAISSDGSSTTAQYVNVHPGFSNNGNYNSRGSKACITINPIEAEYFLSHFDWSNGGTTGYSSGMIVVDRSGDLYSALCKYYYVMETSYMIDITYNIPRSPKNLVSYY